MKHTTPTALITLASALSLAAGCAPVDGERVEESVEAITNASPLRSPSEFGMGAIGVERNGVVTPTCSAVFLYNDILLTHRRCVEGIAWGSRLVATNAIDRNVANREIAPWASSVEWVPVRESSAFAFEADLAMVRLVRNVATGRRDDIYATSGFVRRLSSTARPLTSTTDLQCFGFSFPNNRLAMGHKLVRVPSPARVVTVRGGFGENANPSDDGGACIAPDGTLAGVLRFVDATTWQFVDFSRSPLVPVEIADAYRGSAVADQLGVWPLTFNNVADSQSVVVRLNGAGGYLTLAERPAPIWAQGFMSVVLSSNTTSSEVQIRHRGTGYCVAAQATGFALQVCQTNPLGASTQRFRVTYLNEGSVQVRSASSGNCLSAALGQVSWRACNAAISSQRWWQGFGRR